MGRARDRTGASGSVFAPVGLATHFHTTAIHPWWASSLTRAVTIGAHIFYRWPGQWGDPLSFRRPYLGAEGVIPSPTYASAPARTSGGGETVMGVTIHRGSDSQAAIRGGTSVPVPTVRFASLGGGGGASSVRIHRGGGTVTVHTAATDMPAGAADGAQSSADAGSAVAR